MANKRPEIKYSEPVQDIMGNPPRRILRWGTSVLFAVLTLFILFSWFMRYPDLIPSPVEITTLNPPVTLVSKITGKIKHLSVDDKEKVTGNQVLAVMETAASFDEIEILRQFTDTVQDVRSLLYENVPDISELGELQVYYGSFRKSLSDYCSFMKNDYYGNKITSVKEELYGLRSYLNQLKYNEKLFAENLALETTKFKRDSILVANKSVPESENERSRQALLRQRFELQQVRLEISSKNIEVTAKKQLSQDYTIKKAEETERLSSLVDESYRNLKAQVKIWENTYLLISPVAGTVTFTKYWSENQAVNNNEPVLTIVPSEQGDFIGRIYLKMPRSGKVKTGQIVNIKLSGYPYLEYGMVRGIVKSKSLVPSGDAYVIEIKLPEGLRTLYNRKLDFTQNMQGTAEIITDDMRLLQKIVNPFRYLISKNRRKD